MERRSFREDLNDAIAFHGHLCGGQIIGTRIARYALDYFGAYDSDGKPDLIAFVEADRCLADAIASVTHLTLGKRRLKWMDYGKMAATFYSVETGEAIRIHTANISPTDDVTDKVAFYEAISDDDLLIVEKVSVHLGPGDLPGKPTKTYVCTTCGEKVHDSREVMREGLPYCKACAGEPVYYSKAD
ncbi:MAG: formylmethanofuran dehydrogenase subunit E family protein [Coriobacteriales bacterium]|jgi:formylmethanofuran dehydrogenase subunit E|nr:formylmethanofuran dehydrogenase subunit E family protein [Coriobacteriales bacterium]